MSRASATKSPGRFSTMVNRAVLRKERVVITRRGKKVAAVVPIEDVTLLEKLEDRMDLEDARQALKESRSIPWEKVKTDLGL